MGRRPPVCLPCGKPMRCEQNDIIVQLEAVNGEGVGLLAEGDAYRCDGCGSGVVAGFGEAYEAKPPLHRVVVRA